MVTLNRIYTRGGDKGRTALGNGKRVEKHSARVEAYGTVDEANATLGLARLHAGDRPDVDAILSRVQNDLFDVGADLATPAEPEPQYPPLRITARQVDQLEEDIDRFNAQLEPLSSFILPGGTALASHLHLSRTVTRRAERGVTLLATEEDINPEVTRYLNRLSDLLFVLSRAVNDNGRTDVLWVPGKNR